MEFRLSFHVSLVIQKTSTLCLFSGIIKHKVFVCLLNRLKKNIKGSKQDFGGVSIIGIGDLFQLQPVFDSYIFNDIQNCEYSINLDSKHVTSNH